MFDVKIDNDSFQRVINQEIDKRLNHVGAVPYMMDTIKACEYLSVSRPTLMQLVRNADIPTYSVGKKKLYKRTDIEKLADDLCKRAEYKNYDLLES